MPGGPFGFSDGVTPKTQGTFAVALYSFNFEEFTIPAGATMTVVESNKRWTRYEIDFPKGPTKQ